MRKAWTVLRTSSPLLSTLRAHLHSLEVSPPAAFQRPPLFGPLVFRLELLERHRLVRERSRKHPAWGNVSLSIRFGTRPVSLTSVVLREKLTTNSSTHTALICQRKKSAVHDDLVSTLMRPKNSRGPDVGYLRMLVGHSYPDLLEWSMSTPRCTRFCVPGRRSLTAFILLTVSSVSRAGEV